MTRITSLSTPSPLDNCPKLFVYICFLHLSLFEIHGNNYTFLHPRNVVQFCLTQYLEMLYCNSVCGHRALCRGIKCNIANGSCPSNPDRHLKRHYKNMGFRFQVFRNLNLNIKLFDNDKFECNIVHGICFVNPERHLKRHTQTQVN